MNILQCIPKIKQAYPVVYLNNSVYVGGFGEIIEYEDSTGSIKLLFELMNGKNSVEEICELVTKSYPIFKYEDIIEAIDCISRDGFIEDMNFIGSDILSPYDLKRYHRNINFFSSYASLSENKYLYQQKLLNSKIGIIGLGGLGSHIVYDLAGLGIGTIKGIEFDTVDISNLNRQILYNFDDIGLFKADLAEKRIKEFNPKINFSVEKFKIISSQDVIDNFKGFDLIILVADRPKVKLARWVNEAIIKLNIPLFCAGLEAQRALQYTIIPGVSGCIDCWRDKVKEEHPISHEILEQRKRLNLIGDNTAIVPLVSIATGLLCSEVLKYITGIGELTTVGHLKSIDMNTMTTKISESWVRKDNCQTCSHIYRGENK